MIPHDVAPREVFSEAFDSRAEKHNQTLYGLLIIIFGLIGAAGHRLGSQKRIEGYIKLTRYWHNLILSIL